MQGDNVIDIIWCSVLNVFVKWNVYNVYIMAKALRLVWKYSL
jgi:hypothetical protein